LEKKVKIEEDTHLRHLDRIEKLLAVVASALLLCFKAGEREEKKEPTPIRKPFPPQHSVPLDEALTSYENFCLAPNKKP